MHALDGSTRSFYITADLTAKSLVTNSVIITRVLCTKQFDIQLILDISKLRSSQTTDISKLLLWSLKIDFETSVICDKGS